MSEGGPSDQQRSKKIVALYDNRRPSAGPFLRGPLLETDEAEPYWVTIGFQVTPGSETMWMRYPEEDVTVVPIGTISAEEGHHNSQLLGFSRVSDAEEDVSLENGTPRSAHSAENP